MIRNILVVSDFFRVSRSTPDRAGFVKNTWWLYTLLRRQLSAATGLEVYCLDWQPDQLAAMPAQAMAEALGIPLTEEGWVEGFDGDVPLDQVCRVAAPVFEHALVVGFELSPLIVRMLTTLGVPCVSLSWHPVRFMEDIFFGIRTNHEAVFDALTAWQLPQHSMWAQAELHRARYLREAPESFGINTMVIGQTQCDRSLIQHGRIASLDDYEEPLQKFASQGGMQFRAHPFTERMPKAIEALIARKQCAIADSANTDMYRLLCDPSLDRLVALSSGVLYEAAYFEKAAVRLMHAAPEHFVTDNTPSYDVGSYIPIYAAFWFVDFWAAILAPLMPTHPDNQGIYFKANRMRQANCAYWGYQEPGLTQIVDVN